MSDLKNKEDKKKMDIKKTKSKKREMAEYLAVIILGVALALFVRFNVGQMFMVNGESMEPTFQHGDFAISSIISYRNHEPKIGEVVVVKTDKLDGLEGKRIIKRVIGVEGDSIEIKGGDLYRNDKKIEESYIREKMNADMAKTTVPDDHVFVMGDNRNYSSDSRLIGPVPLEKVQGKVVFELWNNPFRTY